MKSSSIARKTPLKQAQQLARTPFRPQPVKEPKPAPGPKLRKCKVRACRTPFLPDKPFVDWCSSECGTVLALEKLAKQKSAKVKKERATDKKKLDSFKSIPTLKAEAQVIFNRWVRLRDELEGFPCICCGRFATGQESLTGGAYDAAHFRSRGSADHLRYDERNVHRSLKFCNTYGHHDYRAGLIARIGLQAVEALEANQTVVKWTREVLESIKAVYTAKLKALRAGK